MRKALQTLVSRGAAVSEAMGAAPAFPATSKVKMPRLISAARFSGCRQWQLARSLFSDSSQYIRTYMLYLALRGMYLLEKLRASIVSL